MMNYWLRKFFKRIKLAICVVDNLTIHERIQIIDKAIADGKRIVICVYDGFGNSEKYRCYNVMDATKNSKLWQTVFFDLSEYKIIRRYIDKSHLLVFVRMPFSARVKKLIISARSKKIKVLYDIDDLLCNRDWLPKLLKELDVKNNREKKYWKNLVIDYEKLATLADGLICTNEFLAGKLERSFGKPAKVIRNSLNREQVEISEKWVKKKENRQRTDKVMSKSAKFSIGYFSGSPTHVKDFRLVENDLIKFLKNHDDAVLKVVGYMDFSTEMKKKIETGRVEVSGVVDYLKLQELMGKVDVNIAPLVINDFTNCKSELKFFEAAVVETTTIASPTYAFKKVISDGENGFLAEPGEWYDKLEYLYQHPEENRRIALKAKEYALKHYYGKEFLKEVEVAYEYFVK